MLWLYSLFAQDSTPAVIFEKCAISEINLIFPSWTRTQNIEFLPSEIMPSHREEYGESAIPVWPYLRGKFRNNHRYASKLYTVHIGTQQRIYGQIWPFAMEGSSDFTNIWNLKNVNFKSLYSNPSLYRIKKKICKLWKSGNWNLAEKLRKLRQTENKARLSKSNS